MTKVITVEFPFQFFHIGRAIDVLINGRPIAKIPNGGRQQIVVPFENVAIEARYTIYRTDPLPINLSDKDATQLRIGTYQSNFMVIMTFVLLAALGWFRHEIKYELLAAALVSMLYMIYFSIIDKKRYLFIKEVQK
jgi:hypothetical protein